MNDRHPERVVVAMSGGVDSSVAAALLRDEGHDVTGVTLRLWGGESDSGCCSVADVEDARRVAAQLGIPHYVFNLADDFEAAVVGPYVESYAAGETPNPCVECNRSIKFGRLLERALALGFDAVATGHHARVDTGPDGRFRLRRGVDAAKDQSYVLAMLGQRELRLTRLPVGLLTKDAVRARASALGLRTASKPESMDVCFIRKGGRVGFLAERAPDSARPGPIVDRTGRRVGSHHGVGRFTVGQRRGLGVAAATPRYVLGVDSASATVTIGGRDELLSEAVVLRDLTFVDRPVGDAAPVRAQTRAHGTPVAARLSGATLRFDEPARRVAPGQLVALYRGDAVVGSGTATSG